MLDFSLTALLLTYGTLVVSASSSLNLTNTNNITKAGAASGPLSLGDVYDGLSYSLYGKGAFSYAPIAHHSNSYAGPVTNQWRDYYFSGEDLPLYVIYWGSGFTNTQTSIIQMFLTGIGSHPYWKTVSSYSVGGWTASSPKWSGSVSVPCYYAAPYGVDAANGCYLKQYNEQAILSDFIANGKLVRKIILTNSCFNFSHLLSLFLFIVSALQVQLQYLGNLFHLRWN